MLQIQSIMPTSMTPSVTLLEDETMPPPYKVMRRGSQELEDAIQNGLVQLSLPPPEWSSWISTPSEPSPWRVYDSCCQSCNATSGSCLSAGNDVYGPQGAESKMAVDEDDHDDTTSCDPEEQDDPGSPPPVKTSTASQEPQDNNNNNDDESVVDRSLPRFSDIIGHSAVKLRLDEVLLPLALPPTLADTILVGVRSLSASILLFGPPGCGKTQLAKAIAGEAEAAFLPVGPSDIMSKFVGESEASVRSVFDQAFDQARKVNSKCTVLFFDEIDALGQSRGGGGGGHHEQSSPSSTDQSSRRVLAELLIQLNRVSAAHGIAKVSSSSSSSFSTEDSASVSSGDAHRTEMYIPQDDSTSSSMTSSSSSSTSRVRIIVVAATNRPEDCDTALLRRFAVRVMVNLPTQRDRKKILKRYLRDVQHSLSSDHLHTLALETQGWTGSDLESLTREAAMAPIRECIRTAALMKRRNRRWGQTGTPLRQHQCGGSSTSQQDSTISPEKQLLEQFSNLRPVTILDFMNAIAFWAYNHGTSDMPPGETAEKGTFNSETIHYDSSSDEED